MKKLKYDSVCACGTRVSFEIAKPNTTENTLAKCVCQKCNTTLIFTCSVNKKKEPRVIIIEEIH